MWQKEAKQDEAHWRDNEAHLDETQEGRELPSLISDENRDETWMWGGEKQKQTKIHSQQSQTPEKKIDHKYIKIKP